MEKITYIIPIHTFNDVDKEYFDRAIRSLESLKGTQTYSVIIVGQESVLGECEKVYKECGCQQELVLLPTDETDVFKKINIAALKCVTPYFSVLEYDDTFYQYWDEVAQSELSSDRVSVLLPLIENVKTDNTVPALGNEIAWDAAFATDLGYVNLEELKIFKDFNVTGAYINTNDFISFGMLKPSLKIAAWYEYLLRVVNNSGKIKVSSRIGYRHTIFRENSYMMISQNEITQEEGEWLIKRASECYTEKNDTNEIFKKE